MSDSTIHVDRVTKSFGSQSVLQDVSLSVPAGQTLALLGRNGAGKTTTIRVLLGLIPADSGAVRLGGIDPSVDPLKVRGQVGYLAEDQTMYGWMTPTELIRFLVPFYPTWDTQRAEDCIRRFDIPRHTRIGRLSKGQAVKLGLALATAHRPAIVILDDPSMGLDPIARKEFNRDLVEHLQSSGATVLYSSHLLDEVESVADAVAILDQGRIVRVGETESVRTEVKRILVPLTSIAGTSRPDGLLDVRRYDDRLALVCDDAEAYIERLSAQSIPFDVVDLSLDEIFEAFVIGRTTDWPIAEADTSVLA
ncbi:ABC transporter ATP-binding protein [Novipirellula artificiosorum]|uniref:ABC transporter ATP-binding protein YtrB n=1 Tax=Novipirellula artificiosorum TaxID=2528016 RepID=A0A5C6CW50_9BACT|nr:ABC transporter ATP-binding protein [Novipirellula artificiosorum]TWU28780.1 ABC transporter ATP-binding protein YtrB [Novipirellula artificiosorum]